MAMMAITTSNSMRVKALLPACQPAIQERLHKRHSFRHRTSIHLAAPRGNEKSERA